MEKSSEKEMVSEKFGKEPCLRMFFLDEQKDRVFCKIRGKIFFPVDPDYKTPGWHIVLIVEEKKNFGTVDFTPVADISAEMWNSGKIKGVFVKKNYSEAKLEVYPAMNAKRRANEEVETVICSIPLELPKREKSQLKEVLHSLSKKTLEI